MNLLGLFGRGKQQVIIPQKEYRELTFAQKMSAVAALFTTNKGQPKWTPKNYEQFAKEGYQQSWAVYRCITLIARAAANLTWCLHKGEKEVEDPKHALLKLLRRPNPWVAGDRFWEAAYSHILLSGNTYLEGVTAGLDAEDTEGRAPGELWIHRPDRMKVISSQKYGNVPEAYRFEHEGARKDWKMNPADGTGPMLHWKTFNPRDDWYGQSVLEAAAWSVDQNNSAGEWNQFLLQNSGRPGGGFRYKPEGAIGATLTVDQREQLQEDLKKMSRKDNIGRNIITDGGLEYYEMALSPKEMDWLQGKDASAREICAAFGVPSQMLGIPGSQTHANYEEARLSLYQEVVIPLANSLTEELNHWLLPAFSAPNPQAEGGSYDASDLMLKVDLDDCDALALIREKVWARVAVSDWLTLNEKREATGYDKLEDPAADEVLVDAGKVPLGTDTSAEGETDPNAEQPVDEDGNPTHDADGKPIAKPVEGSGNAAPTDSVQAAAMNGTQITALQSIIQAVTDETMDPDAAVLLICACFPTLDPNVVQEMVDAANEFTPVAPEPTIVGVGPDGKPLAPPKPGAQPSPGKPKNPPVGSGKKPPKLPAKTKQVMHDLRAIGFTDEAAAELIRMTYGDDAC